MIYYCTYTVGGSSRGVGVLQELGEGVLVTPYRMIARLAGLPWFRHVPLPLEGDVLIYDRIAPCRDKGKRVTIGYDGDVDLVVDWPITSHHPDNLDRARAEEWWSAPMVMSGNRNHAVMAPPPKHRVLACRGGKPENVRAFREMYKSVRVLTTYRREFYWPAIELMTMADEVIGERQVQNEWAVVRGDADPDGAKRAAAEIRRLLR